MDRKHTVLAASGVSVLLVAGSTAFAFANGIFVSKPVAHVGRYQAINVRLVPATKPVPTSTPAGAPPRKSAARRGAAVTQLGSSPRPRRVISATERSESSIGAPAFRAAPAPKFAPAVRAAATPVIAHSGPSAVSPAHGEDDHESVEGHESVESHESDD